MNDSEIKNLMEKHGFEVSVSSFCDMKELLEEERIKTLSAVGEEIDEWKGDKNERWDVETVYGYKTFDDSFIRRINGEKSLPELRLEILAHLKNAGLKICCV